MNELNHTNGKGDKERSPGWRNNYDEINFPPAEGFVRRGNRMVKCYTPGRKAVFKFPELGAASKPTASPEPLKCGGHGKHTKLPCSAISAGSPGPGGYNNAGWCCSLEEGHAGPHIACINTSKCPEDHGLFSWPKSEAAKPTPADLSEYMLKNGVKL
jgi:hypothetical protein